MPEPRRILIGVTSDISLSLIRGFPQFLVSQGWQVHVVSAPGPLQQELRALPGITVHSLPMAREPRPFADARALVAWIRLLRRVDPRIVSVGTPKAGLLGGIAARLTRVPARVYHLRGLRLETTKGIRRRVYTVLERVAMSSADTVIAVSDSLMKRAIELRLVSAPRIRVLGRGSSNGVLIPPAVPSAKERAARRRELGLDATPPVVGFVGRLTVDKGLDVLAAARGILEERGVDHQMLIVGGVDEQASPTILHELRSVGRSPIETGHVPDTRGYYAAIDILCLPTLREGFPNVVLEAAAAGVPTVTTDATGAVDSVVEGETGLLATAGDPATLADRLQELIEASAATRARFGRAAREHVERHYSREHVLALFDEFLTAAASTRSRGETR